MNSWQFNNLNLNKSNELKKELTNKNILQNSFFDSSLNSVQISNNNVLSALQGNILNKNINTKFNSSKLLDNKSIDYISSPLPTFSLENRILSFNEILYGNNKPKSYLIYQYIKNCLNKSKISLTPIKASNSSGIKFGTFLYYNKIIGYNFNSTFNRNLKNINTKLEIENNSNSLPFSNNSNYSISIKNTYKLLSFIFKSMYCLISKPVINYSPDRITIQLFYYLNIPKKKVFKVFSILYNKSFKQKWFSLKSQQNTFRKNNSLNNSTFSKVSNSNRLGKPRSLFVRWKLRKAISRLKGKNIKIRNLLFKLRKFNLTKVFYTKFKLICDILSNKFNKSIELQLTRLHNPIHDSNILVNLLALNIKNKRKKSRTCIQKIYSKNAVKKLNDPNLKSVNFIPAFISGLNIQINGRLMREPIIPRLTSKVYEKGAVATGKVNYLDVASITKKNRKGAYTIKITKGQNFF